MSSRSPSSSACRDPSLPVPAGGPDGRGSPPGPDQRDTVEPGCSQTSGRERDCSPATRRSSIRPGAPDGRRSAGRDRPSRAMPDREATSPSETAGCGRAGLCHRSPEPTSTARSGSVGKFEGPGVGSSSSERPAGVRLTSRVVRLEDFNAEFRDSSWPIVFEISPPAERKPLAARVKLRVSATVTKTRDAASDQASVWASRLAGA